MVWRLIQHHEQTLPFTFNNTLKTDDDDSNEVETGSEMVVERIRHLLLRPLANRIYPFIS
jgi:hypothetical protein